MPWRSASYRLRLCSRNALSTLLSRPALNNWKSRLFGVYRFHFLTHSHSRQRSFIVTRREMKRKRGRVLGYRTIYSSQNALRLRGTRRVLNQSSAHVFHLVGLDCQRYHRDIHIADQNDSLTWNDVDFEAIVSNYRIARNMNNEARQRETSKSDTWIMLWVCCRLYKLYYLNAKSLHQRRLRWSEAEKRTEMNRLKRCLWDRGHFKCWRVIRLVSACFLRSLKGRSWCALFNSSMCLPT